MANRSGVVPSAGYKLDGHELPSLPVPRHLSEGSRPLGERQHFFVHVVSVEGILLEVRLHPLARRQAMCREESQETRPSYRFVIIIIYSGSGTFQGKAANLSGRASASTTL